MQRNKFLFYILIAFAFNFTLIFFVTQKKQSKLNALQNDKAILSNRLSDINRKYDSTLRLYKSYYGLVYSSYRHNPKSNEYSKLKIENWASFYHYYEAKKNTTFDLNLDDCSATIQINDLRVWFITEDEIINDYAIKDSLVITGNCSYTTNCKRYLKTDNYDFQSYTFNRSLVTYYPSTDDDSRIYIHADAREYWTDNKKICKVIFTEHNSNKIIGVVQLN